MPTLIQGPLFLWLAQWFSPRETVAHAADQQRARLLMELERLAETSPHLLADVGAELLAEAQHHADRRDTQAARWTSSVQALARAGRF